MSARWTPEAENAAAGLWAEGNSAREIADLLHSEIGFIVTRDAVMGKLHRLGLLGRRRGPSPCRGIVRACFGQAWAMHKARQAA